MICQRLFASLPLVMALKTKLAPSWARFVSRFSHINWSIFFREALFPLGIIIISFFFWVICVGTRPRPRIHLPSSCCFTETKCNAIKDEKSIYLVRWISGLRKEFQGQNMISCQEKWTSIRLVVTTLRSSPVQTSVCGSPCGKWR